MEQIKKQLLALSPDERNDVSAFLWHFRSTPNDPEHRKLITERLDDKDPNHWLTLGRIYSGGSVQTRKNSPDAHAFV